MLTQQAHEVNMLTRQAYKPEPSRILVEEIRLFKGAELREPSNSKEHMIHSPPQGGSSVP